MKNKKEFVIFDLEATCYESNINAPVDFFNEIIDIGAVKVDEDGKIIDQFSKFAKPKTYPTISKFCNELTTITQDDIDNAEPLKNILEEFLIWSENSTFISWGFYDIKQLSKDLIRNDLEIYLDRMDDHHSLKHLHAKWNKLKKRNGIGMNAALKMEGLNLDGTHHRGIDDAINITKIFKKYINKFL